MESTAAAARLMTHLISSTALAPPCWSLTARITHAPCAAKDLATSLHGSTCIQVLLFSQSSDTLPGGVQEAG